MAIFHITPATSRFTSNPGENALGPPADDTPGADTLIVDPGAYLISVNVNGAFLANTGAWTVTVNGSIVSQNSLGIALNFGNTAVSTIKIGVDGEVQGGNAMLLGSSANINNAGVIAGSNGFAIEIVDIGTHTITNSGEITASGAAAIEVFSISNDTVRNSGTINGAIELSAGTDKVTNTGTINGLISLGDGTNKLTNSGTIDGFVSGGSGADTVTNFAIIVDVIKSGTITGTIRLGAGNDKFTGGANPETVQDGDGADVVSLGGGNDTYLPGGSSVAGDGIDIIKGGAGIDTYDASGVIGPVAINLDNVAHEISPGMGLVAANTATGPNISGTAKDTITGFENANGGHGSDLVYGTAGGNTLTGGDDEDFLFGFGGNDKLDGGVGDDLLVGGLGKDQLTGGLANDTFRYAALSDSGVTAATRDLVADFVQGVDKIDLSLIDANKTTVADDPFQFIGNNVPFTGAPGQLHAFWTAIGQMVEGDVNGDAKADFSIELQDPTHAITLTNTSFNL
jgi:Ca2+-binding RTX toxin-like protein